MNKAMKRSLLYTFILLLTALALTATGVYAWYTNIMAIRTSDATDGHANVGMRINLLFDRLDPAKFSNGSEITFPDGTTATFSSDADWGSPANPYIISLPRHMINLYALQESGYFYDRYITQNYEGGDPATGDYLGTSVKPYFLVCETDATPACINGVRAGESITIKPVGNDEYPFIGAIGGAQAEGTATAPNNMTSISSIIANFTVEAPDDATDIGLFGKIGYLGKEPENATEGQTFTGSISGVSDLLLYDVKIVSEAKTDGARDEEHLWESDASNNVRYEEDHHVGILAGHIEYAAITNISVYYSSDSITAIDVNASGANYLSDSGIIGLVYNLNPETSGNSIGCATGTTIAGAAKGAGNEWGASIDMKTMHARLQNVLGVASQAGRYVELEKITTHPDGTVTTEPLEYATYSTVTDRYPSGSSAETLPIRYYFAEEEEGTDKSSANGSFVFALDNGSDNGKRYNLMHGTSDYFFPKRVEYIGETEATESGFTISNGGVYLNAQYTNAAALVNGNSFEGATVWQLDAQGHLFAYLDTNPNNNVSTGTNDYVKYYLNASNTGALSLSTSGSTVWTKSENTGHEGTLTYQSGGLTWYLRYNGGVWDAYPASTSYKIHSGNYYFGVGGTDFATVASANAAAWFVDGSKLGTLINGTVYYLVGSTDGSGDLSLTNTRANGTDWNYTLSGGTMTYTAGGRTWHLFALDGELRVCPYDSVALISQNGYYLNRASATAVNAGTDASSATAWNFDNGTISTYYNGNTYYLNASGANVSVSTTRSTTWTKNNDGTLTDGNGWYLVFSGGWKMLPTLDLVSVHSGTDYLSANGTSVANSADAPAYWIPDGSKLYTVVGTTNYYLRARASGLDLVNTAANGTNFTYDAANKTLTFTANNTTYYVVFDGTNWTVSTSTVSGGPISARSGYTTYYLNASTTEVSTGTGANNATDWVYNEATGRIYTTINNTTYYLRGLLANVQTRSTTNLAVTTNENDSGTAWEYSGNNLTCTLQVDNADVVYTLTLENNTFKLMDMSKNYYTIENVNSGNYLNVSDAANPALNASNSDDNAVLWSFSNDTTPGNNASTNTTVSTVARGVTRYLVIGNNSASISNNSTASQYYHYYQDGWFTTTNYYYIRNSGGNYYLRYNNGWTSRNSRQNNDRITRTEITFTPATVTITGVAYETEEDTSAIDANTIFADRAALNDVAFVEQSGATEHLFTPKDYQVTTKYVAKKAGGNPTYFPLVAENTSPFKVNPKNTGYVVGGSRATYQDASGDVRVSYYPMNSISASLYNRQALTSYSATNAQYMEILTQTYLSGGLKLVKDTYNSSHTTGFSNALSGYASSKKTPAELGLTKYDNARAQLHDTFISSGSSIYGMHFMDAAISMDNMITAPKVMINGQEYENYQMPEDSIDFRLRTKGYVNFFAGTYYTNNNSFFSLNQIFRNSANEITSIKRISKIYGVPGNDKKAYIYQYGDGTYSKGTSSPVGTDGYVEMFDTKWIEQPTMVSNAVYYYEVPVNAGEYALGSVEGRRGAYLFYLDIGTSAADRTSMLGTIDFVYDNKADKIVVVPDTSENDTSLNYYVPSLAIMYTNNNDENDSVKIDNFTVKVTRTIGSVNDANATLNATFGGSDAEHLDVIPQHSGGDTINKSTA